MTMTIRAMAPLLTLLIAAPVAAQEAVPPPAPRPPVLSVAPVKPATMPAGVAGPANPDARLSRQADSGPGEVSHNAPVNGVLTLYGNQRCPTDREGGEVVVCVRQGAAEQYRIPKALRDFQVTPQNEAWASRVVANDDAANVGIGSCTTVGPGGSTGCFLRQARQQRAEKKENQTAERQVQESLP